MKFTEMIGQIWKNVREDGFDLMDVLVPILIKGAGEVLDAVLKGEDLNNEFQNAIQGGYYLSVLYYDNLVSNPDETFTDEFLNEFQEQCRKAAAEGDFVLDEPTHV